MNGTASINRVIFKKVHDMKYFRNMPRFPRSSTNSPKCHQRFIVMKEISGFVALIGKLKVIHQVFPVFHYQFIFIIFH